MFTRDRIPHSEIPTSSLPISGKKPVASYIHSDVRAGRIALCASVMLRLHYSLVLRRNTLTSFAASTSTESSDQRTEARSWHPQPRFGSHPVLGNQTVRGRRLRLGARTDDKMRIDSILFLTYRPCVYKKLVSANAGA